MINLNFNLIYFHINCRYYDNFLMTIFQQILHILNKYYLAKLELYFLWLFFMPYNLHCYVYYYNNYYKFNMLHFYLINCFYLFLLNNLIIFQNFQYFIWYYNKILNILFLILFNLIILLHLQCIMWMIIKYFIYFNQINSNIMVLNIIMITIYHITRLIFQLHFIFYFNCFKPIKFSTKHHLIQYQDINYLGIIVWSYSLYCQSMLLLYQL